MKKILLFIVALSIVFIPTQFVYSYSGWAEFWTFVSMCDAAFPHVNFVSRHGKDIAYEYSYRYPIGIFILSGKSGDVLIRPYALSPFLGLYKDEAKPVLRFETAVEIGRMSAEDYTRITLGSRLYLRIGDPRFRYQDTGVELFFGAGGTQDIDKKRWLTSMEVGLKLQVHPFVVGLNFNTSIVYRYYFGHSIYKGSLGVRLSFFY